MEIIGNSTNAKIIEQKYIDRVLKDEARNIFKAQKQLTERSKASPETKKLINSKRRFQVSNSSLEGSHAMLQRFIDMRNIRGLKRKPIPVHNKIIYYHFNSIINKLAFGLTDDVRNLIAKEYKIEN
ncbi:hypothetical protein [Lacinutrix sp. Hel_I_90]|uniref:hypothetical protein n=1 Tax=Lacinutrix sp. Hel_I_90 TaxID=1249999 RepID=UPI0005CA4838|nr:hypothetical protein [Lacinutrix sp. Hel_I_90]